VFPLVFPTEVAAEPDIGPSFAAGGLAHPAFKRVEGAVGIGRRWLRLAQHFAKIKEMLLVGASFREVGLLPLGDEFLGCHTRKPLLAK
jgi:hypothetical protein